MKAATLALVIAVFATLGASRAQACECGWVQVKDGKRVWLETPPPLTADEVSGYRAVFEGTVKQLELDSIPTNSCQGCVTRDVVATFAVRKIWRAEVGSDYQVRTPWSGPACEYRFRLGEDYLVYVKEGTKDYNYGVDRCSRTKLLSDAQEELRVLQSVEPAAGVHEPRRDP
jgi:hypothetical protein